MGNAYASLTLNEAHAYVTTGKLPESFKDRAAYFLYAAGQQWVACDNCGGVSCMHMVLRDWHEGSGIDECDGLCCPDCGDFWRAQEAGR